MWTVDYLFSLIREEETAEERNSGELGGVTVEAKSEWKYYEWGINNNDVSGNEIKCKRGTAAESTAKKDIAIDARINYGSMDNISIQDTVAEEDDSIGESLSTLEEGVCKGTLNNDELPTCSICLCEYELREKMLGLPCGHIYHESCIDAWTERHDRCPLCNYDLMETFKHSRSIPNTWRVI